MEREFKQIQLDAIEHFGEAAQILVAIEELGELTAVLARYFNDKAAREDIVAEIIDVKIMLDQLTIIFEIGKEEAYALRRMKLLRVKSRYLRDRSPNEEGES